jgi:hypothetical protein
MGPKRRGPDRAIPAPAISAGGAPGSLETTALLGADGTLDALRSAEQLRS